MSYLISKGSINDFAVRPTALSEVQKSSLQKLLTNKLNTKNFAEISSALNAIDNIPFVPDTIVGEVLLKELTLRKNFEGTLANLFRPNSTRNEVYFLAWSWDLSGKKLVYPFDKDRSPDEWVKSMRKNDTAKFMQGDGLPIFPKGEIKGGVGVHIELWESDKGIRQAGEKILKVKEVLENSDLSKIISGLTAVTKPELELLKTAGFVLAGMIANILKANEDDHIALFEGYFTADKWKAGIETWKEPTENDPACEIIIERN
jgi:hypothetical protein